MDGEKKVCIFAHYDKHDQVDDYVLYYLEKLREITHEIIFVSTSELKEKERQKLVPFCTKIITRKNQGYDFMSWKIGMKEIDLRRYQELILCNDSCYGPVHDLKPIFDRMTQKKCDFWGITESYEYGLHLQSYFLVFSRKVFLSRFFKRFWNKVVVHPKELVCVRYEVGLSKWLFSKKFIGIPYIDAVSLLEMVQERPFLFPKEKGTPLKTFLEDFAKMIKDLFDTSEVWVLLAFLKKYVREVECKLSRNLSKRNNPTHLLWKETMLRGSPFLKIELVRDNPVHADIRFLPTLLKQYSTYNPELIKKHLERIKGVSWTSF